MSRLRQGVSDLGYLVLAVLVVLWVAGYVISCAEVLSGHSDELAQEWGED
jgi:hypothetical protein